ncbi:MAG: hypothetical protein K0S68_969 [Candidatus Saccharibacteria bacterium]|jgi:uncharacterized spore protein YtfJ|nr:hypothetical protein [Candidatus Saccharibacteria bacterium]
MDTKELMSQLSDRIGKTANVRAVFGDPVGEGEDKVIPVARVSVRGIGGGGNGDMPEGENKGKGSGIGLGLNLSSNPVGFIRKTESGSEFVPIVDQNRMIMAAAGVAAAMMFAVRTGIKVLAK